MSSHSISNNEPFLQPFQLTERKESHIDLLEDEVASAVKPIFSKASRSGQKAALASIPEREVVLYHETPAAQPYTPAPPPQPQPPASPILCIENCTVIAKQNNILYAQKPPDPNIYLIDMEKMLIFPYVKYKYGDLVWAPNPKLNNEYCLGKMMGVNTNINFEPINTPAELVPYMMIEFDYDRVRGNPPVSIHRGHLWPTH